MKPVLVAPILLSALLLAHAPAPAAAPVAPGDRIFQTTKLHRIRLTIPASEWAVLQTSNARNGGATGGSDYRDSTGRLIHVGSGFAGYFPWVRADVQVDSTEFKVSIKDAGLRYKGNLSFSQSSGSAPLFANFKLKFDVHDSPGSWDGEKTFNLHAGVVDTSKMRDAIAFHVFRAAGVPASRTAYAELIFTVPGVYNEQSAGLFTMIEDVNKRFLERVLPPGTGLLMKPEGMRGGVQHRGDTWAAYVPAIRPAREATKHEQDRIMSLGHIVSQPDVPIFRAAIGGYIEVDQFLRFVAVNALLANTDSYNSSGHNYYLYLDPKDDRLRFIPWDQDLSMGSRGGMNTQLDVMRPYIGDAPLIYWLLDDPAVFERYRAILKDLAANVFTKDKLLKLIDDLEAVQVPGSTRGPVPRAFIESRTAYLQQLVAAWK